MHACSSWADDESSQTGADAAGLLGAPALQDEPAPGGSAGAAAPPTSPVGAAVAGMVHMVRY